MSKQGEATQPQATPSFSSFQAIPTFTSFQPPQSQDSSSRRKEKRSSKSPTRDERRYKKEPRQERQEDDLRRSSSSSNRQTERSDRRKEEERTSRRRPRDHDDQERERKPKRRSPSPPSKQRVREDGESTKQRPILGPMTAPTTADRALVTELIARRASPPLNELKGVFYTQRSGDASAAQHGGQESSKVPKFNRVGYGAVLGLPSFLRITKDGTSGRSDKALAVAPRTQHKRVRYTDPSHAWKAHATSSRRLLPSGEAPPVPGDFVRVTSRRTAPSGEEAKSGPDYRSLGSGHVESFISGETNAEASGSSGSGTDEESTGEDLTSTLRTRIATLDMRVRTDATDVESWLSLAHLQAQLARTSSPLTQEAKKNKGSTYRVDSTAAALARVAADAQLAVLAKASRLNPSNVRLARVRIDLGEQYWEREKVEAEWKELVDRSCELSNADLVAVWQNYVAWKTSDCGTVGDMIQIFERAFRVLRDRSRSSQNQTSEHEILELGLVWHWTRAVHFLGDAGFHERAFALIQAQLEFTFCAPESVRVHEADDFEAALQSLEAFWDDEVPRLGEEGAKGWRVHASGEMEEQEEQQASEVPKAMSEPSVQHTGDDVQQWLSMDRERVALRRRPARTTDEPASYAGEQEVDPYALILFSDIRALIVPLTSPRARAALLDAALTCLGVPPGLSQAEADQVVSVSSIGAAKGLLRDPKLTARFWPARLGGMQRGQAIDKSFILFEGESMQPERRSGLDDPYAVPLKLWPPRIDELFTDSSADKSWFSLVDARDLQSADVEAASLVLDDLPPGEGGLSRTLARFAVEDAARGHDDAVTLARGELSVARKDLSLWRAYASLEARGGKIKAARRVYKNALALAPAASSPLRDSQSPALWQAWVELEMVDGRPKTAVNALLIAAKLELYGAEGNAAVLEALSVPEQAQLEITATDVEQARSFFLGVLRNLGSLLGSSLARAAPSMASCAALLEQLTSSGLDAFEAACAMFQLALDALDDDCDDVAGSANSLLESLYMSYARYLWRQVSGAAVYRPAFVRSVLTQAVQRFPSNTAFLSLLAAHEMRSKIEGHLRLTLEKYVLPQLHDALQVDSREDRAAKHEVGWIFAIYAELNVSTHNFSPFAVRRLFERALAEQSSTRYSSVLWHLFLSFEVRVAKAASLTEADTKQRQRAQMSDSDDETYECSRKHAHADSRATRAAREQAKRVLYRALQACPFNRELYLTAFAPPLREAMSNNELQDLYRILDERQLRIHVALDEVLGQEVPSMVERNEGGAWDEAVNTDEEKEMAERKALMPY